MISSQRTKSKIIKSARRNFANLNNGAENLSQILLKMPNHKKNILQKLVFILNTVNKNNDKEDITNDEAIIRSATRVMTHSMSRRLADNFVSAIYNNQN